MENLAHVTPKKIILFFCQGYRFELDIDLAAIEERTQVVGALKGSRSASQVVDGPKLYSQFVSQIQVFRASADRTAIALTTISPLK